MIKVRVYEVARELGLDNRELVNKIASLGIQVRNHMSALEPGEVDRIKRALEKDKHANVVEERIRPTVVRRRAVATPASASSARRPEDEHGEDSAHQASGHAATTSAEHGPHHDEDHYDAGDHGYETSHEPAAADGAAVASRPASGTAEHRVPDVESTRTDAAQPPKAVVQTADRSASAEPTRTPEPQPIGATASASASEAKRPAADVAATVERAEEALPAQSALRPAPVQSQAQPPRAPEARDARPENGAAAQHRPAVVTRTAQPHQEARSQTTMHVRPETRIMPPIEARRPTAPPPASERLGHSHLPPGVVARGNTVAPSAPRLSSEAVSRIVAQHNPAAQQAAGAAIPPRRRELGRAALGAPGRPQPRQAGRPGRARKLTPGRKAGSTQITTPSAQKRVIRIEDQVSLQQLAQRMSLKATDVLMKLVQLGMTGVNINSKLDADTAKILANEFAYEVENVAVSAEDMIAAARGDINDQQADYSHRPPIVTVMGHVDHGKTSLLDKIRSTRVAAREAGGITQHIGAYRVDTEHGPVVFLDTPGHEAFTAMRARGASATDVVILVVAADDGVMPQTREAIAHAKAAGVPIVVAVNKIDKEGARPDVVMRTLANEGLQSEEWGGDVQFQNVSAHTGEGLSELLKKVILQSEMLELSANPKVPAEGVVLEAYLDKGRGPVANILVRNGTLRIGDLVVAGQAWGKVKAMSDDRGRQLREAGAATPVEILGLSEVPGAGESVYVVTDAKKAQEIADARKRAESAAMPTQARLGLDQIHQMMASGEVHELKLIIKADVQGSAEALVKALTDLSTDKVKVTVIHQGVGGITENDVLLATASNCIVIGFNVRPAGKAADVAKSERVDVRLYRIIYEAVDEVKKAMAGMLAPSFVEKAVGKAEVRQVFVIPKVGAIAGSYVLDGKILRSGKARVTRDGAELWKGSIKALRRFKDDVRDVAAGYECGISLEGFNELQERDVIECFELEKVAAQL
jgi:translation initiation factor IF-2